ncbi:tetratricopeptide repeat protein 8 [Sinocyclocheilus rhinocerous]|uniref:tetratricopeptide repeat protein 8 n=1 Tax=Sinocyclocheilus rhinocerous TaxID=307959 RepID=UPI0007B8D18D|nr:PREDICTED: tetratricopeptide repeat protein 8-like [Sinocyclocheilus rhinocerous]
MEVTVSMEPLFLAWSSCRRRRFQRCADICSQLLSESPLDQAAWSLKTRALTEMVYIDEVEVDQEGIADMMLDESSIAQVARPGTTLRLPGTSQGAAPTPAVRLGLHREAEKQFRSALTHQEFVDTYLYLAKVYQRLDQPITALNVFKQGLDHFPAEVTLLTGIARIQEEMNNMISATEYYKEVLKQDNTHVEAIACIGSNHFYTDQPEIALRFYRRLLQMGVFNCQLYNNLGLCCFYAQQYDMTLSSFERALALVSSDEEQADIWYNLGHVAVGIGDLTLAYQCFKLALAFHNNHGEAYNNLAVLELRKGRIEQLSLSIIAMDGTKP